MGLVKASFFIVFVSLLCTIAVLSSEGRNSDEEAFLRQLVDPESGKIDEDTVRDYNLVVFKVLFPWNHSCGEYYPRCNSITCSKLKEFVFSFYILVCSITYMRIFTPNYMLLLYDNNSRNCG